MSENGYWLVGQGHPSEKYESVGMMSNPIYGKIKNGNQTTDIYMWGNECGYGGFLKWGYPIMDGL